jgi:hypothetical protein
VVEQEQRLIELALAHRLLTRRQADMVREELEMMPGERAGNVMLRRHYLTDEQLDDLREMLLNEKAAQEAQEPAGPSLFEQETPQQKAAFRGIARGGALPEGEEPVETGGAPAGEQLNIAQVRAQQAAQAAQSAQSPRGAPRPGATCRGAGAHLRTPADAGRVFSVSPVTGAAPIFTFPWAGRRSCRLNGHLRYMEMDPLTPELAEQLNFSGLNDEQRQLASEHLQIDFSLEVPGVGRHRCSVFRQRLGWDGTYRIVRASTPTLEELGLPTNLRRFTEYQQGPRDGDGAGGFREDHHVRRAPRLGEHLPQGPHPDDGGPARVRAPGQELLRHAAADRAGLPRRPAPRAAPGSGRDPDRRDARPRDDLDGDHRRRDGPPGVRHAAHDERDLDRRSHHRRVPDRRAAAGARADVGTLQGVISQMRDLETIAIAIETAETGHLVFGTLHTTSAPSTVDRIIDQFPADRQEQIRTYGRRTENFGYKWFFDDVPALAERLSKRLSKLGIQEFDAVTHSMGGIVLRWAMNHQPMPRLRRAILIAPPNAGAWIADHLHERMGRFFPLVFGQGGLQMRTGHRGLAARAGAAGRRGGRHHRRRQRHPAGETEHLPHPRRLRRHRRRGGNDPPRHEGFRAAELQPLGAVAGRRRRPTWRTSSWEHGVFRPRFRAEQHGDH